MDFVQLINLLGTIIVANLVAMMVIHAIWLWRNRHQ